MLVNLIFLKKILVSQWLFGTKFLARLFTFSSYILPRFFVLYVESITYKIKDREKEKIWERFILQNSPKQCTMFSVIAFMQYVSQW